MPNSVNYWAAENEAVLERFIDAVNQMSLEAGAAGDSIHETGSLDAAAPAVDAARAAVARATADLAECPPPPNRAMVDHWAAMIEALDAFRTADDFNEWVRIWTVAMSHRDGFFDALAHAAGQA